MCGRAEGLLADECIHPRVCGGSSVSLRKALRAQPSPVGVRNPMCSPLPSASMSGGRFRSACHARCLFQLSVAHALEQKHAAGERHCLTQMPHCRWGASAASLSLLGVAGGGGMPQPQQASRKGSSCASGTSESGSSLRGTGSGRISAALRTCSSEQPGELAPSSRRTRRTAGEANDIISVALPANLSFESSETNCQRNSSTSSFLHTTVCMGNK